MDTETQEGCHEKKVAETRVLLETRVQTNECLGLSEAGRGMERSSPKGFGESMA